jgi:hypothetical protein
LSSFVRDYIRHGRASDQLRVEPVCAGTRYDPFHTLAVAPTDDGMRIDTRFFRWIGFIITFMGFDYRGPDSLYYEDIESRNSLFARSRADAKRGEWYRLA